MPRRHPVPSYRPEPVSSARLRALKRSLRDLASDKQKTPASGIAEVFTNRSPDDAGVHGGRCLDGRA